MQLLHAVESAAAGMHPSTPTWFSQCSPMSIMARISTNTSDSTLRPSVYATCSTAQHKYAHSMVLMVAQLHPDMLLACEAAYCTVLLLILPTLPQMLRHNQLNRP